MKIQQLETFCNPQSSLCLVRVTDDQGGFGWGQVAPFFADVTAQVVHRQLAKHVLGYPIETATDIIKLADTIRHQCYKFHGSHLWRAWAGIDLALWDLLGRRLEQSVASLLNPHHPVQMLNPWPGYASSLRRDISPMDEAERMKQLRDRDGYKAFKIRIAQRMGHDFDASPGRTEQMIQTCRLELGDDAHLLVDANSGFTVPRAIEVGRLLQDHGFEHFEEPCPFWDFEQSAQVAATLDISVAGGEQDYHMPTVRRMIEQQAVDILQPDVCYAGGLARAMEMATMAEQADLLVVPHSANRTMVLLAAIHLMNAIPNAGAYVEVSIEHKPDFENVFEQFVEIRDGLAHPPQGPGFAVTPQISWLERSNHLISQ